MLMLPAGCGCTPGCSLGGQLLGTGSCVLCCIHPGLFTCHLCAVSRLLLAGRRAVLAVQRDGDARGDAVLGHGVPTGLPLDLHTS